MCGWSALLNRTWVLLVVGLHLHVHKPKWTWEHLQFFFSFDRRFPSLLVCQRLKPVCCPWTLQLSVLVMFYDAVLGGATPKARLFRDPIYWVCRWGSRGRWMLMFCQSLTGRLWTLALSLQCLDQIKSSKYKLWKQQWINTRWFSSTLLTSKLRVSTGREGPSPNLPQ